MHTRATVSNHNNYVQCWSGMSVTRESKCHNRGALQFAGISNIWTHWQWSVGTGKARIQTKILKKISSRVRLFECNRPSSLNVYVPTNFTAFQYYTQRKHTCRNITVRTAQMCPHLTNLQSSICINYQYIQIATAYVTVRSARTSYIKCEKACDDEHQEISQEKCLWFHKPENNKSAVISVDISSTHWTGLIHLKHRHILFLTYTFITHMTLRKN